MSISSTNYVNIISGQGAGIASPTRDLYGRFFTANSLLPPQTFVQFSNAAQVLAYFGAASEEYARALFYFGFISKNLVQPGAIQFSRWVQPYTSIQTGTTTTSMATITGLTSTAGLTVGSLVTGAGIPANTVIASITNATSLIMSANSTAGATESITFSNTGVAPTVVSAANNTVSPIATWQAITSGDFLLTVGGVTYTILGLDFSGDTTFAQVAATIQAGIRALVDPPDMLFYATVTFQTTGYSNGGFVFTGGAQLAQTISISGSGDGGDISGAGFLGWSSPIVIGQNSGLISNVGGAIWTNGSLIETLPQTLTTSASNSNNFGSFAFLNNLGLTLAQVIQIATWNITPPVNVNYLYCIPVSYANYSMWAAVSGGVGGIGSCCMTLQSTPFIMPGFLTSASVNVTQLANTIGMVVGMQVSGTNIQPGTTIASINSTANTLTLSLAALGSAIEQITFYPQQFPEQFPMMIEAATNYGGLNSVQNYMFQIDNTGSLTPSVTSDSVAAALDALFVNYYGSTQTSGALFNFYQRGAMMGQNVSSNIPDITSYVNEIWFKDAVSASILALLLTLNQIPANTQGEVQILGILQSVINQAVNNGTISVGKMLTAAQITYITSASGYSKAWYQVQNLGYWANCIIQPNPNRTGEYEAVYTLIYSKDDTIRFVSGTQTLI